MWEDQAAAERFYNGRWRKGIIEHYGNEPKIEYSETVALADKANGCAGGVKPRQIAKAEALAK